MDLTIDTSRAPNPIDRHVGLRIRMRRKELGISQERLAESIGLTFQQVQKYERAANRVSASKLWELAAALHTNVSYFYEGFGEGSDADISGLPPVDTQDFLLTSEGLELANSFPQIPSNRLRRKILDLVRMLGEPQNEIPT